MRLMGSEKGLFRTIDRNLNEPGRLSRFPVPMNHYCFATLQLKRCRIVPASTAGASFMDIGVM